MSRGRAVINPRRACARVTVVAVCVYSSVTAQRPFKHGTNDTHRFLLGFSWILTNETQQLREGQLVGRMLLQRLATGATGVKQARYRRGPTRGSEALYAHAQYNTQYRHLLFNAWCNACI